MSGTLRGGKLAARTNLQRYGETYYQRIGAKGGSRGHTGGFYDDPERASYWGTLGGSISRRGKKGSYNPRSPEEKTRIRRNFEATYQHLLKVHTEANRVEA